MGKVDYYVYQPGVIDFNEFLRYLQETDHLIIPKLSSRVDLVEYAKKVTSNATMFVAKVGKEWVGVEAVYFHEYPEFSFSTYLCVKEDYQKNTPIGMELMLRQLRYLKENRTKGLRFAIRKSNTQLLNYHLKTGGRIISEHVYPGTDIIEVEMEKIFIKD